jgi:hypothetical protein
MRNMFSKRDAERPAGVPALSVNAVKLRLPSLEGGAGVGWKQISDSRALSLPHPDPPPAGEGDFGLNLMPLRRSPETGQVFARNADRPAGETFI